MHFVKQCYTKQYKCYSFSFIKCSHIKKDEYDGSKLGLK